MPQKLVGLGKGRRVWNNRSQKLGLCHFLQRALERREGTIRKCIEVTSACDYNENVLDFGMASIIKLFLMEIKGNMIGLLKVLL